MFWNSGRKMEDDLGCDQAKQAWKRPKTEAFYFNRRTRIDEMHASDYWWLFVLAITNWDDRSSTVWYGIFKRYWYSTVQYQALRVVRYCCIILEMWPRIHSLSFSLLYSTLLSLYLFILEHDKNQMRHGPPPPPWWNETTTTRRPSPIVHIDSIVVKASFTSILYCTVRTPAKV